LAEELLFRGVLQASLAARLGAVLACFTQAALFGLMHSRGAATMITVFVGGLGFGALALWRRCLLSPIIAHAAFNAVAASWLVALVWLNAHTPAENFSEAAREPDWWHQASWMPIAEKATAREQHAWALQIYGSPGLRLRRTQVQAFTKVRQRFPRDEEYAALSLLGIQEIYLRFLNDPRRAIVAGRKLLTEYPRLHDARAKAMLSMIEAYVQLEEYADAANWIERAEAEYGDQDGMSARLGVFRRAAAERNQSD
jgi:hypothetical protein